MKKKKVSQKVVRDTKGELDYCVSVSEMSHLPLVVLDKELCIRSVNQEFYKAFKMNSQKSHGRRLFGNNSEAIWTLPHVENLLKKAMRTKLGFRDYETRYNFPGLGVRHVIISGQKIKWVSKEPPSILLTIRDITKRKKIEQKGKHETRLAQVLEIVTAAANTAMSLEEVSQSLLEAICIYTGWEFGHAYLLTKDPSYASAATDVYHYHHSKNFSGFWKSFEKIKPEANAGLSHQLLLYGKPQWTMDVFQDSRFSQADFSETGVRAAFAFPVLIDKKVAAILEFFSAKQVEPDDKLLKLMSGIGYQIGQVVQRKRIEDENAALLFREHEARAKAEKDNRTKDFFLATLSHELRTPLTSILLWIQIVRDEYASPEKIKKGLEAIEQGALMQEKLINDLLDTSRIIMGKLSLETSSVDLATVILTTIESLQIVAKNKSIQFETKFDKNIGTVSADALRLQQVFWNLISNAIKFSRENGKITISLASIVVETIPYAEIKVTDMGEGIHSHFLTQVFDWFSQADNSRIREHNGLGIGLAISKNLVELQGGTIKAESLGVDLGTTITVQLPLRIVQGHPVMQSFLGHRFLPKVADIEKAKVNLTGIKVLIIDNEETIINALSIILNNYGAKVAVALSAEKGFELFSKFKPDVLLCDIAMPHEDGYSLIRRIRALGAEHGGDTPSAALTAYVAESDVKNALDAGFQMHVSKPIDMHELVRAVLKLAKNK